MGRLRRSSSQAAKTPYYAEAAGIRIFTGEELGYFIGHYLYLIDESFFSASLKRFLSEELNASNLAAHIDELIEQYGIYSTAGEIAFAVGDLDRKEKARLKEKIIYFDNMSPSGRKKLQADNLLKSGDMESAITIYRELLENPAELSVTETGQVYAKLAYASMEDFDWENAGIFLEAAYGFLKEEALLKQRYAVSAMNHEKEIPPFILKYASEAKIAGWHEELKKIRYMIEQESREGESGKNSPHQELEEGILTSGWNREFRKNHKTCCQIIDFSV